MLWRRADLEHAGGIEALGKEVAEDAAATKVVRGAGLKVRLVDRPLAQPLGRRTAAEVWNRQVRWARLRRASFFDVFPARSVVGRRTADDRARVTWRRLRACRWRRASRSFGALWYGGEMLLAAAAGWHVSPLYPLYGLARDLLLPVLFVSALRGDDFVWRGNEMQVERMRPHAMMALVRPRLAEIAPGARRRTALAARADVLIN